MSRKHALVIGGTGMLSDVSLWLVHQGYVVSVIGRSQSKHEKLKVKTSTPERIHSLRVDYRDQDSLEAEVRGAIKQFGPISVVVSWIPSLPSLELISSIISETNVEWKLHQVKGSRRYFEEDDLKVPANCHHRSIYLGFVIEADESRWLTNEEISSGVIRSMEEDAQESIIGVLHPYEARPGQ